MLMDEKLISTLDKILRLCNQNAEFDKELRKRLGLASSANALSLDDEPIRKIEKYLGLDYSVDSLKSTIDYSFIQMDDVRNQLISDYREMMRFRYGTRYHEIDFDEFCRYALLQAEMLLNYYYDVVNHSDLGAIISHIKTYNTSAKISDDVKTLSSISFNVKLWAFKTEHKMEYSLSTMLDNIRMVRNELSHRSTIKAHFDIEAYQTELRGFGIPLYANGFVNTKILEKDHVVKNIFDTRIAKTEQYKEYKFMLWYIPKPFESIINGIIELSQLVDKTLK